MFDSIARLLGFGDEAAASQIKSQLWNEYRRLRSENAALREEFQKEIYEIWERNHKLESENSALNSEVDELKKMLREAKYPATVRLEREMEMREKAAIETARAWSEERGFDNNCLTIEEEGADINAPIREKYPWRHVPGMTCEQPGKMRIEENHGD